MTLEQNTLTPVDFRYSTKQRHNNQQQGAQQNPYNTTAYHDQFWASLTLAEGPLGLQKRSCNEKSRQCREYSREEILNHVPRRQVRWLAWEDFQSINCQKGRTVTPEVYTNKYNVALDNMQDILHDTMSHSAWTKGITVILFISKNSYQSWHS